MPLLASRRRRHTPYSNVVLADGPAAYWRLNEASGNFLDSSGNSHPAIPSGTITRRVSSPLGNDPDAAAAFAASSGYANAADFNTTATYSLEAWVKGGQQNTSLRHLINRDSVAVGGTRVSQLAVINADHATTTIRGMVRAVWFNSTGANAVCYGPARVDDGVWHHVVFVVSGGNGTIWVDGVAGTPVALAGVIRSTGSAFGLAQTSVQAGGISGALTLDEVAVYAKALSGPRIIAHYNAANLAGAAILQ